jgi:hypothetical protein
MIIRVTVGESELNEKVIDLINELKNVKSLRVDDAGEKVAPEKQ